MFRGIDFTLPNADKKLWQLLVDVCTLTENISGDIILSVNTFKTPLKEQIYENYLYSEQAEDVFFIEITLKTKKNYLRDFKSSFLPLTN